MSNKLSIGAGIAQGTNIFLQSFMAARAAKEEREFRKKQPLLQALYRTLEDDDTPLRERNKILDEIGWITKTTKPKERLSDLMQLTDLEDMDIDVGESGIASKRKTITSQGESIQNQQVQQNSNNLLSQTDLLGIEQETGIAPKVEGIRNIAKRGDLSPNDRKSLRDFLTRQANTEFETKTLTKRAELELEAKRKTLVELGYNKKGETFIDEAGNSFEIYTNPNAPIENRERIIPLGGEPTRVPKGKLKPEGLIAAETRSLGSGGTFGQLSMAYRILDSFESNPNSVTPESVAAARNIIKLHESKATTAENTALGTTPQNADDLARLEKERRDKLDKFTTLESEAFQASRYVGLLAEQKTKAAELASQYENEFNNFKAQNPDYLDDNNLQRRAQELEDNWIRQRNRYNEIEQEYSKALARDEALKGQVETMRKSVGDDSFVTINKKVVIPNSTPNPKMTSPDGDAEIISQSNGNEEEQKLQALVEVPNNQRIISKFRKRYPKSRLNEVQILQLFVQSGQVK